MNERIKELAEQAGAYRIYDLDRPNDGPLLRLKHLGIEKFAELIVRECIGVCNEQATYDPQTLPYKPSKQFADAIKEHFGVEA